MTVDQELQGKVEALRKRDASLDENTATARILNRDPVLYEKYRRSQWTIPATPESRPLPAGSAAEAEVFRRAEALVSKAADLDLNAAIAQVFADDPALYRRYALGKQADFGTELLSRQLDLYDYCSALQATIAAVLDSDAADKGSAIVSALDDFRAAVLSQVREAGLAVVEKQAPQHPLAPDILALAQAFSPDDLGVGLVRCRQALALLKQTVERKRAAA